MILVLGSGVAGISCALAAAARGAEVVLATPGAFRCGSLGCGPSELHSGLQVDDVQAGGSLATDLALAGGNTALAQGGIAAALGDEDRPALHAADTIAAGAGLVDPAAAAQLARTGAARVRELLADGFIVDRGADGLPSLGLEAAHGLARIVHAGEDRTGAALHATLAARLLALAAAGRVRLIEHRRAVSLLESGGTITGAVLRDARGHLSAVQADAVVLATGGYAALYPETSNHSGARGEGIVLAARFGAVLADLEFVQFHPTVLAGTGSLISEAVRGAGAVLVDGRGKRFMQAAHERAELAPRDVVSREAFRAMRALGDTEVWLDATGIERAGGTGTLARRFPSITAATRAHGFDWTREAVPVAPAAHYTMGGIVTDLDGRTSLPGLFAAGEVANTGVHGANRLASNSLLEGLVFGSRAGNAAFDYARHPTRWELRGNTAAELIAMPENLLESAADRSSAVHATPVATAAAATPCAEACAATEAGTEHGASTEQLGEVIAAGLGIERDASGLRAVLEFVRACPDSDAELAGMIAQAALARTESRGAHQRRDHPEADPAQGVRRSWHLPGRVQPTNALLTRDATRREDASASASASASATFAGASSNQQLDRRSVTTC